jgi:uncharacterized YccA/Bax inhibitor family protein
LKSSSNPMLKVDKFKGSGSTEEKPTKMSFRGISDKALLLLGILLIAGGWTWRVYSVQGVQSLTLYLITGIIACIGLSIYIFRNPDRAGKAGPFLAGFEGFVLGSISAIFEVEFSGIVVQTMASYIGVMLIMIMIHKFSHLRITSNFNSTAILSFSGIIIAYLSTSLFSLLGIKVTFLHETGVAGVLIALLIIIIATGNIIHDFKFLEESISYAATGKLEWYAASSLMVSLVWLYLEFIRHPAKLKKN